MGKTVNVPLQVWRGALKRELVYGPDSTQQGPLPDWMRWGRGGAEVQSQGRFPLTLISKMWNDIFTESKGNAATSWARGQGKSLWAEQAKTLERSRNWRIEGVAEGGCESQLHSGAPGWETGTGGEARTLLSQEVGLAGKRGRWPGRMWRSEACWDGSASCAKQSGDSLKTEPAPDDLSTGLYVPLLWCQLSLRRGHHLSGGQGGGSVKRSSACPTPL